MGDYVKHRPGTMKSITFEKEIAISANGQSTVTLSYKDFPQLTMKNPHLWWPNGYGEQNLHNLALSFTVGGKVSAAKNVTFGIREVASKLHELNGEYGRVFYVNGQRIFCKGGWMQPDMLLDNSSKNIYDQARLMTEANLNVVSSEDMPAPSAEFMEVLDKYGLMWWEVFYQCFVTVPGTNTSDNPSDHRLAKESTLDLILRYRNDPCVVAWCAANETLPDSDLYFALKNQIGKFDTTRVFLAHGIHCLSTLTWWTASRIRCSTMNSVFRRFPPSPV
jgi:beta-galactosidase/beta-glucuronidase